jgi:hypothetical protein
MHQEPRRDRLWFGIAILVGPAVVLVIGPAYLQPLPNAAKVVVVIVGALLVAALAIYSRRRARRA